MLHLDAELFQILVILHTVFHSLLNEICTLLAIFVRPLSVQLLVGLRCLLL